MPLIHLVTRDMFQLEDAPDYYCNPVNLLGVSGAGLALEFKKRAPTYIEPYKEACRSKDLRVGTVQVIEETGNAWGIINVPTKRHYADQSDENDIRRSLEALRDLLQTDRYKYASIVMPMLGCGCGAKSYEIVYPMMIDYLANLDATVVLSMSPDRTEMRPKYLTIVGPPSFAMNETNQKVIDATVDKVMTAWGNDLSDYTGIISGGYPGVDSYICGETYLKDKENTFVFKKTQGVPLVVKPNKVRNGVTANLSQNNLLCELADDIILFKPVGHNNNRMTAMQMWLKQDKENRIKQDRAPRNVAIFGEHEIKPIQEPILIPVNTSDEY